MTELVRVSKRHIDEFKAHWLANRWPCAICRQPFTQKDPPVVDHCHYTGIIRGVLHQTCNRCEGELTTVANWSHKGVQPYDFLIDLGRYLNYHKEPRTVMVHPHHRFENERKGVPKKKQFWRNRRK